MRRRRIPIIIIIIILAHRVPPKRRGRGTVAHTNTIGTVRGMNAVTIGSPDYVGVMRMPGQSADITKRALPGGLTTNNIHYIISDSYRYTISCEDKSRPTPPNMKPARTPSLLQRRIRRKTQH